MNTPKENVWLRLVKKALSRIGLQKWPAPDLDANSSVLAGLQDNDPVYRCLLDHLMSEATNNLLVAVDPRQPGDQRLHYLDRMAGVLSALDDIEARREILCEEWRKRQQEKEER